MHFPIEHADHVEQAITVMKSETKNHLRIYLKRAPQSTLGSF